MTRRITTLATCVLAMAILLPAAPAAAQDTPRPTADSVRPQDTRPSIPVGTPTLEPRGSEPATGAASPQRVDPDAPVSNQPGSDPAAGGQGDTEPAGGSGVSADGSIAAPYAAGLPERAGPPRTLRAHWHVFIAFAVVWLLLFGYAISVGRRFARLEDEVRRLGGPAA